METMNLPLENRMQSLADDAAFPRDEAPVVEMSDFLGRRQGEARTNY